MIVNAQGCVVGVPWQAPPQAVRIWFLLGRAVKPTIVPDSNCSVQLLEQVVELGVITTVPPQPYWYVTPNPDPGTYDLPDLPGGYWNTEGWFGAVLPGSAVVDAGSAAEQASLTEAFLREAVSAGKVVLGG